jgi:hypothetical protein
MVAKSDIITGGAFRRQLMADSEFSLNLWENENIEGYNRWGLIGLWNAIFLPETLWLPQTSR